MILNGCDATECGPKNTMANELAMAATMIGSSVRKSSALSIPTSASPASSA
jgi:hypothetical protein